MYKQLSFDFSEDSDKDLDEGKGKVIYLHQRTASKGVGQDISITEAVGDNIPNKQGMAHKKRIRRAKENNASNIKGGSTNE